MADTDTDSLAPQEAAIIANNVYFTLKGWIANAPVAAQESTAIVKDMMVGSGGPQSTMTLKRTNLMSARVTGVFSAETGLGTTSGFGCVLVFNRQGRSHVVIALRGTRGEMAGAPDLISDLRFGMTPFASYGPVHIGFKKTYETILPKLGSYAKTLAHADVVHCVGHSLGGGVATLVAATLAERGKAVKLYTFGSPRVGAMGAHWALEQRIGAGNIYRVAHDLDPVTMIAPFPYAHVNGRWKDPNNLTVSSPTLMIGLANHDMNGYREQVSRALVNWDYLRLLHSQTEYDTAKLAMRLLGPGSDPGWVQFASEKTLALLFKLLGFFLARLTTQITVAVTAVDLLAQALATGLHKVQEFNEQIVQLLGYAARWAGIQVSAGAEFTREVISAILGKMMAAVTAASTVAVQKAAQNLRPLPLMLIGGALLISSNAL